MISDLSLNGCNSLVHAPLNMPANVKKRSTVSKHMHIQKEQLTKVYINKPQPEYIQ